MIFCERLVQFTNLSVSKIHLVPTIGILQSRGGGGFYCNLLNLMVMTFLKDLSRKQRDKTRVIM